MTKNRDTPKLRRLVPSAPQGFDKDRFFEGVYWHQRWELFDGIFTPGKNPIELMCQEMNVPEDLTGKRVLDIGAWNGCLSFECERRGAREVIALGPEEPAKTGFYRLRDVLGSKRTHYVIGSVYDLNPAKLGYFDVVMLCGVLYHLRYPILGIDNIRRVCTGEVFVETIVNDAQLVEESDEGPRIVPMVDISPRLLTMPLWQFFRKDELENDPSNWFTPSTKAVLRAFESAGFEMKLLKNFGRGTFQGRVKDSMPEFLTIGSTEGGYYDSVTSHLLGKNRLGLQSVSQTHLTAVLASPEYHGRCGEDDALWVGRLYADLLGRVPDQREVDDAMRGLCDGYAGQREILASSLLLSTGHEAPLIASYYTHFLGRAGAETEIQNWVKVLRDTSEEQVLAGFLSSDEYFLRHGGSNAHWLEQVYRELLGRQRAPDDVLDALNRRNITRHQIILEITADPDFCGRTNCLIAHIPAPSLIASEEYYRAECGSPTAWVARIYAKLLGRSPQPLELEDALGRLHQGYAVQRQVLVNNVVTSLEYRRYRIAFYYQKYLGRAASNRDIRYWYELLQKGVTEEQALAGFLSSDEYFSRQGNSSARWLDEVYQELLGRKADPFSKKSLFTFEKRAALRNRLLLSLVANPEYQRHWVHGLYTTYLGRPATDSEMNSWTHVLWHSAREPETRAA
jgi:tRNA (mo5U34)-methyltransferase